MEPELREAVRIVLRTASDMGLEPVLIGALVSELAAPEEANGSIPRGTLDADFALQLRDWTQFAAIKSRLVDQKFRAEPKFEHRLLFGNKSMIDLVPYGPVSKDGDITWPDSGRVMDVVGFDEACGVAVPTQLDPDLRLRRLTIPGLALLKIFAFTYRHASGNLKYKSDAEDLLFWYRNYATGALEERRFTLSDLGVQGVDFTEAGAALLGFDVVRLASVAARERVKGFARESTDIYSHFVNALVSAPLDDARPAVAKLATAFLTGINAGSV